MPLQELTDEEIDALVLLLFNSGKQAPIKPSPRPATSSFREFSHDELLRIRSRNHPDKWPNVNPEAYQAAVEELDRRRRSSY